MFPFSPKNQFLGSLLPSTGTKTTTASTTKNFGPLVAPQIQPKDETPIVSDQPAATSPITKTPTVSTPKQAFVASTASNPQVPPPTAPAPITSGNVQTPSGATVNAGTGGLVTAPPVNQDLRYGDAYEAYIRTLAPSQEETDASTFLNNLMLQQKRDQETALGRGETLGFATGEAARVNRENAFQIEAAANAVDALTGRRSANKEVMKARLDFEKSIKDDKTKAEKDKTGFSVSPGEDRYEYDQTTKSYKKIASGQQKAESAPKLTADERKSQSFSIINDLLNPGESLPDGTPYLDQNGYLNPKAFRELLAAAREAGITRKELITQYSHLLFPGDGTDSDGKYAKSYTFPGYGLSLAEIGDLADL